MWQVHGGSVKVHGGSVDVTDETTLTDLAPAATVRLNEVALNAQRVAWPMAQPVAFNGSAAFVGTEGLTQALPQGAATGKTSGEKATAAKATNAKVAGKSGGQADSAAGTKSGAQASPASASDSGSSSAAATAKVATAPSGAPVHASALGAVPSLEFQGTASLQGAEVNARVAALPLALAAPYLAPHLVPRLSGNLDAHVGLQWAPPKAQDLPADIKVAADRLVLSHLLLADDPAAAA